MHSHGYKLPSIDIHAYSIIFGKTYGIGYLWMSMHTCGHALTYETLRNPVLSTNVRGCP